MHARGEPWPWHFWDSRSSCFQALNTTWQGRKLADTLDPDFKAPVANYYQHSDQCACVSLNFVISIGANFSRIAMGTITTPPNLTTLPRKFWPHLQEFWLCPHIIISIDNKCYTTSDGPDSELSQSKTNNVQACQPSLIFSESHLFDSKLRSHWTILTIWPNLKIFGVIHYLRKRDYSHSLQPHN